MLRGSIVALITPFRLDGEVDYKALQELIEWHIEEQSDGILLLGTTGEAPTLNEEEFSEIVALGGRLCRNRVPLFVGTGTNDTRKSVLLTKKAKQAGADGCLVVVPYYNKPTLAGCKAHFQSIAQVGLPIFLYHHPGRTGVRFSASALAELASIPQVIGIKECSGELDLTLHCMQLINKPLFCGDDILSFSFIQSGAAGVISVIANIIPKPWKQMTAFLQQGNAGQAKEIFDRYFFLLKAVMLESNPMGIKFALSCMGRCTPQLRLPLTEPLEETKEKIQQELANVGLIELPVEVR
jgi:4-hydroxy-tetrahydrodipicolinate synthase